jgi:hypothetical protein
VTDRSTDDYKWPYCTTGKCAASYPFFFYWWMLMVECCESGMFISDAWIPIFSIPDPGSKRSRIRIQELKYF